MFASVTQSQPTNRGYTMPNAIAIHVDVYDRGDMLDTLHAIGMMWDGQAYNVDATPWTDPYYIVRETLNLDEANPYGDEMSVEWGGPDAASQLRIVMAGSVYASWRRVDDRALAQARLDDMAESWIDWTLTDRLESQRRRSARTI